MWYLILYEIVILISKFQVLNNRLHCQIWNAHKILTEFIDLILGYWLWCIKGCLQVMCVWRVFVMLGAWNVYDNFRPVLRFPHASINMVSMYVFIKPYLWQIESHKQNMSSSCFKMWCLMFLWQVVFLAVQSISSCIFSWSIYKPRFCEWYQHFYESCWHISNNKKYTRSFRKFIVLLLVIEVNEYVNSHSQYLVLHLGGIIKANSVISRYLIILWKQIQLPIYMIFNFDKCRLQGSLTV